MKHAQTPPLVGQSGAPARGFTLLELLMALAVLAIVLSAGVPSFQRMMEGWRLTVTAAQMQSHLNLTRAEAMKRNARVAMCKSADGETCALDGGWERGWIVFHDANNSGARDVGESLVARHQVAGNLRVVGNAPVARYVSYSGLGNSLLVGGGFQAGTITLCAPHPGPAEATLLIINSTGRVRARKSELTQCT